MAARDDSKFPSISGSEITDLCRERDQLKAKNRELEARVGMLEEQLGVNDALRPVPGDRRERRELRRLARRCPGDIGKAVRHIARTAHIETVRLHIYDIRNVLELREKKGVKIW